MGDAVFAVGQVRWGSVFYKYCHDPEVVIQHLRRIDKTGRDTVSVWNMANGNLFIGHPLEGMQFVIAERDSK